MAHIGDDSGDFDIVDVSCQNSCIHQISVVHFYFGLGVETPETQWKSSTDIFTSNVVDHHGPMQKSSQLLLSSPGFEGRPLSPGCPGRFCVAFLTLMMEQSREWKVLFDNCQCDHQRFFCCFGVQLLFFQPLAATEHDVAITMAMTIVSFGFQVRFWTPSVSPS